MLCGSQELYKCAKKCSNPSMGEVDNLAAVLAVLEVTANTRSGHTHSRVHRTHLSLCADPCRTLPTTSMQQRETLRQCEELRMWSRAL